MKKRYWLRGLIAGGLLGVTLSLSPMLTLFGTWNYNDARRIFGNDCYISNATNAVGCVPNIKYLLVSLVAGLIIGWIYGKFKNRNKVIS